MIRVLSFILLFSSNYSSADEVLNSLHQENLLEIMAYGFGAAEAITNLGVKSDGGKTASGENETVFLPVVIESISGISVKRINKESNETILAELNVTRGSFTIPFGGTLSTLTKEYIISSLGEPAEVSQNEFKYYVPSHMDDNILIFSFEKNKTKSIKWVWWAL